MTGPPVFQRSPRLRPELPEGEVEIPAPPAPPVEPNMSALSLVLAMLPGLLGAVIMYAMSRAGGAGSPLYLLYSLPMMAAGYGVQLMNFGLQKRKYRRDVERREEKYRALLAGRRQQLERQREQQQAALRQTDPDPGACLERVLRLDARLWERSPQDPDFLTLRLGLGKAPFAVAVKAPRQSGALDGDLLQQEALALAGEFGTVPGVPVCLPLRAAGAAGLVGERAQVLGLARALAVQLATHHSPDDVKLVALFPAAEADAWAWLRWLPHVWSDDRQQRFVAVDRESAHRLLMGLQDELGRRKLTSSPRLPVFVFLLADPALTEHEAIMPLLLREGTGLGALALVLAGRKEELPMECRAIVEVAPARAQLILTAPQRGQADFFPDACVVDQAERLARALAPVRPQRLASAAEIPRRFTLLDTLAVSRWEELNVAARWRACEPDRTLAAPIGAVAGGERLLLDLHERAHGPHGLVAGATGSGKSELLQTLIASLSVSYHPHDLAFMMIDYKGGGMANAFRGLMHLVGTITNLEGSLSRRALAALKAELKRRQRLLGEAGVAHIDEYIRQRRQGQALEPLPHLVVVVDEFAELKAEQPEFMRELISAVRVGRSLGVHLLLATQKPSGVVDEQIWSNTRFRLCLRVERPEDSQEVLRSPEAAALTGAGRAIFQVGNNERFELFQAGWGGAPYLPDASALGDPYAVAEVALDGRRISFSSADAPVADAPSQLEALVAHLQAVAEAGGIAPLPGPWLPPLPEAVPLVADGGGWMEPVVGLVDDPENQRQDSLRINLGKDGHLAVFGAPGNGKSTFLQTLVTSLALTHSPAEVQIYIVDGSGRSLRFMAAAPHVGAVITADETERITRLMRFLLHELEVRKERLARLGVGTMAAYRMAGGEPLPAICVVMDNFPALADVEEPVAQLAREGGNHGIHLVVTAGSPGVLRHRVASNITAAVALGLADRGEYSVAVGRTGGLEPAPVPGRGLVKGAPPLEFQTALPAPGTSEWERTAALKALFERLDREWTGVRPPPVRTLPDVVSILDLAGPDGAGVPLGLEVDSLEPLLVDLADGPHFLVAGPPGCGKTSLLATWVRALGARYSPDEVAVWVADPSGGLRDLPNVRGYCTDGEGLAACVDEIAGLIAERRRTGLSGPLLLLVMDDFDLIRAGAPEPAKEQLEQMVRRERGMGFHLLAAGPAGVFSQYSYEGLVKALVELQTGFVLGSNDAADLQMWGLYVPSGEPRRLPPGQGHYVRRGRARAVKVALSEVGRYDAHSRPAR